MNSLDALLDLGQRVAAPGDDLQAYFPRKYIDLIAGQTAAQLGGEPILHMRNFQREQAIPFELTQDILERHEAQQEPMSVSLIGSFT